MSAIAGGTGIAVSKMAIDFESAFAGVEKTVDGTAEQLENIKQGIIDLSTETASSASDIAAVAEAAGQLGIKTDDILEFTKVMVMLGDSTNLSATQVASLLAKFANITKMSAKDYDKLGSVIVDLGNNFATTETDIVEMATRLAATGELAGFSESQIMALATAMSSVGIEAESGGSSFSKLTKQIQVSVETGNSKLNDFARVAGVSSKEFKRAFQEDAVSAIGLFISGLNDTERNGKSAIATLDDMGLTEVRLSNTILSLASSGDLLTNSINTANGAWESNSALTTEAEKRYGTTQSKLTQVKNSFVEVGIQLGEVLLPFLKQLAEWLKSVADKFSNMNDATKTVIVSFLGIVTVLAPLLIIIGKVATGISAITSLLSKVSAIEKFGGAFKKMGSLVKSAVSGISAVIKGLFTLITAHPVIAIITAIVAVVTYLYTQCEWFRDGVNAIISSVIEFFKNLADSIVIFFTETIPQKISEFISFLQSIPQKISDFVNSVVQWFSELPYKIGFVIGQLIGHLILFGQKLIDFIIVDIPNFISGIIQWFAELPGKIWEWLLETIVNIAKWGAEMQASATKACSDFFNSVINFFVELPSRIWEWLTETIKNIVKWGYDLQQKGKKAAADLMNSIVNGLKSLPGKIMDIGKNLVKGLWDGIKAMGNWIKDKVGGFFGGIVDGIKNVLGIHSPSRVMRDLVGKNIVAGVGTGIEKNLKLIKNPMKKLTDQLTTGFNPSLNSMMSYDPNIYLSNTIVSNSYLDSKIVTQKVEKNISKAQLSRLAFKG